MLLSMVSFVSILFFVVLMYSADIHGMYRPTVGVRLGVLLIAFIFGSFNVVAASIREGPALVTSGAISLNPTEDHPIFACRSNLSPDHDLAVDERMIIAARGLWLALITILLQDERRLLLMTMGDRIMRQLQQLSLRMLKRRRAVIRVVRSLMPMVLLDIIKDQAVQGEDGK